MSAIPISPPPQEDEVDEILKRTGAHAIPTGQVAGAQASPAIPTDTAPDDSSGAIPTQSHPLHQQAGVASLWSKASNIHNPVLRVLGKIGADLARGIDVAGSIAAPGVAAMIPGSTLNADLAENRQRRQATEDTENQQRQATTAHTQAETGAIPAQTEHTEAETEAIKHPPAKPEKPEDVHQIYADAVQDAVTRGVDPTKDPKVQQLADSITQLNKEPAAKGPDKLDQQYADAIQSGDHEAAQRILKVKSDLAKAGQAPQREPQAMMMVPDGKGGETATVVHPGSTISSDATKPGQNPLTSSTRTMIEAAPGVLALSARVRQLVDQQEKSLGPAASRWAEFMAGKVGAPNPEFTKLRTDVGLLTTKLMRMHVGARGGQDIMHHFQEMLEVSKQSPENLRAALEEIDSYAKEVQGEKNGAGAGADAGQPQATHIYDPATGTVKPVQ